ncbi:MAG: hypothetical protein OXP69_02405 [Spirochaetaceae bacterium]|nr:hypothetical protein [Spirochaetaceae bacterium]
MGIGQHSIVKGYTAAPTTVRISISSGGRSLRASWPRRALSRIGQKALTPELIVLLGATKPEQIEIETGS